MNQGTGGQAPFYKYHVFCCTHQRPPDHPKGSCTGRGSMELVKHLKDRLDEMEIDGVRINSAGCLGRCESGPTMVIYPEGVWYRCSSTADVDQVLESHIRQGKPVERLMLGPDDH